MKKNSSIITVGLCPAWDVLCKADGLDWGQHRTVSSSEPKPAGKALNISQALAWMGQRSAAAGLWGQDDFEQMLRAMRPLNKLIKVKMTPVKGRTRQNVTIVDTKKGREMHLRNKCGLASKVALRKLQADLGAIVRRDSVCVFAGAMPNGKCTGDIIRIIDSCRNSGAEVAVDTNGDALKRILKKGGVWLIKPNVEELRELLGEQVKDSLASLVKAGRRLLDKAEIVLISRGKRGAIVVTADGAWQGKCTNSGKVLSTVGCGDFLLAGFLKGLKDKSDVSSALETAIKVATARAWGWTEEKNWAKTLREIKAVVKRV